MQKYPGAAKPGLFYPIRKMLPITDQDNSPISALVKIHIIKPDIHSMPYKWFDHGVTAV